MNINRHNCEEFFLLYVDNELSAAERKAVDMFVKENPDLLMELTLLQQTVLKTEDIVLDKKDWLYMEATPTALQEDLLLYADDELAAADKKLIESLLLTDKTAQAEWNILQQTKLQPETIVFEDKASLYRQETGKVIGIKWWRVAAAAVLLGFGLWGGVSVYNNSSKTVTGSEGIAKANSNSTGTETGTTANSSAAISPDQNTSATQTNIAGTAAETNPSKNIDNIKVQGDKLNNNTASKNNIAAQSPERQDNNLLSSEANQLKTGLQNINSTNSNQNTVASVLPSNNDIKRVSGNNTNVVETNTVNTSNNNNSKADQPVAIVQVSNREDNNSTYLNIDEKQKRTALGGLIRKAKRVVERTTNINTGEGVKIAGFEIALK